MKIELSAKINDQQVAGLLELKKLADTGNLEACNSLAIWLISGLNCSPDTKMAFYYFEKAAKQGYSPAMINLALCYAEGRGVDKNFDMAELWIKAASESGDSKANVPARQIYISTIGNHAPNMREYVDFLFKSHYPNGTDLDEKTIKENLITKLILSELGKEKDWEEIAKLKATENDIKSFEIMNDIYYGDFLDKKKKAVAIEVAKEIIDSLITEIESFSRDDIAERVLVLYNICKGSNTKKELKMLGEECSKNVKCDAVLDSFIRAKYGILENLIGAIESEIIEKSFQMLREKLNSLENEELQEEFSSKENNEELLKEARKRLAKTKLYNDGIRNTWIEKITSKIIELQNASLSKRLAETENDNDALQTLRLELKNNKCNYEGVVFEEWQRKLSEKISVFINAELQKEFDEAEGNYEELYRMLRKLRQEEPEPGILEKWDSLLSKNIGIAQKRKLEELCSNLANMEYQNLLSLIQTIKENYSFDNEISQSFILEINKYIESIEKQELDMICANIVGLSSIEYNELIDKIEKLGFNPTNTSPYIEKLLKLKNSATIIETCIDANLQTWKFEELEAYLDKIDSAEMIDEKKKELKEKVNHYINLYRECKDPETILLLNNCETEALKTHSIEMLQQLKKQIEEHSMLPDGTKLELIDKIELQIKILTFEGKIKEASDDYDYSLNVLEMLSKENLPQEYKSEFETRICNNIIKAQKSIIASTISGIETMSHEQLRQARSKIHYYDFYKNIFEETLLVIDKQINVVEAETLAKMCKDLSTLSAKELKSLREKINQLGFADENTKSYLTEINTKYGELVFDDLTKQCTQVALVDLAGKKGSVENILTELENCGKDKDIIEPYIKRVSSFIKVRDELRAEISNLYSKHFNELQEFAISEMSKFIIPEYSKTRISFKYKTSDLNSKEISARIKKFPLVDLECVVFLFDDTPTRSSIEEGFCVTNFAIHQISDNGVKSVPLENVTGVKTGKLFETTTISSTTDTIKFSMRDDFDCRNSFANILMNIISVGQQRKRRADAENQSIITLYSAKYDDCFANTPIPNDKTFADKAREIKEETRKAEAIANSPALTPEELMQVVPQLVAKYGLSSRYHVVGTQTYINKLPKARAAYATYDQSEFPLVLEDHTIFGSAKEGFVLTNKALYIHAGSTNGKISLERIRSVFDSYDAKLKMHHICMELTDSNGTPYMSYCGEDSIANGEIQFWTEVLELLGRGRATNASHSQQNVASNQVGSEVWMCSCGKTNEGKFCPDCGAKRETGTPIWKCSCGNLNKGKFCPNCGSQKP